MAERQRKKESGGVSVYIAAFLGGSALAMHQNPTSILDDIGLPSLSVHKPISVEKAERRFDCDLQETDSPTPEQVACAQKVAKAIGKTSLGWSNSDADCLNQLWHNESNWNIHADNPTSSAYGIPQALTQLHTDLPRDYENNPVSQIRWGTSYIKNRYDNPCNALDAWEARSPHWY